MSCPSAQSCSGAVHPDCAPGAVKDLREAHLKEGGRGAGCAHLLGSPASSTGPAPPPLLAPPQFCPSPRDQSCLLHQARPLHWPRPRPQSCFLHQARPLLAPPLSPGPPLLLNTPPPPPPLSTDLCPTSSITPARTHTPERGAQRPPSWRPHWAGCRRARCWCRRPAGRRPHVCG